jgi:hypothetical protein
MIGFRSSPTSTPCAWSVEMKLCRALWGVIGGNPFRFRKGVQNRVR